MVYLKNVFKGSKRRSSQEIRISDYDDGIRNQDSASMDSQSKYNENREEEQGKKKANANLEEDEQLKRPLQEILNAESRRENYICQPTPYQLSSSFGICAGCNNEIGQRHFVIFKRDVWHPECLLCRVCRKPIDDYELSDSVNSPYHRSCYKKKQYVPICQVCKQFIPVNTNNRVEYMTHPFWKQKCCPSHAFDGTPMCGNCERMEPTGTKYVTLDDGRKICLECLDSAIMDTNECKPLYNQIKEFFANLNMKIEQKIPLSLVEKQALNKANEGEKHVHSSFPVVRGACLRDEYSVDSISRTWIGTVKKLIGMTKEPYEPTRRCVVNAILVLYGQPRLLTGCVLAHEMMHAWLHLNGYRNLRPKVEEGICEVLAHMWLESELKAAPGSNVASTISPWLSLSLLKKCSRSPLERKLGAFFKNHIEADISPVYGDGFRAGNQAALRFGLKKTLDHIRRTGNFPC